MKKAAVFLLVFAASRWSPAFAQSAGAEGHELSLGVSFGLMAGEGEETVFRNSLTNDKLSELLWQFDPLVYAGAELGYAWRGRGSRRGFFARVRFRYGFPGETGVMEDRDWIDATYTDWLTHYSVSGNHTETAMLADCALGVSFAGKGQIWFRVFAAYHFMSFSWRANGGSLLYPSVNGGHGLLDSSIDVITYEQKWHIVAPGIALYGAFNRWFDIEIFFEASPLIWSSAKDEHLLRALTVTDSLESGFFFEPGLVFSFRPNRFLAIALSVSYRSIRGVRGDGYYDYENEADLNAENLRGAGFSAVNAGIMLKFTPF